MNPRILLALAGLVLTSAPLAAQIPAVPPSQRGTGVLANDSTRDRGPAVICDTTVVLTAPADTSITTANRVPRPQCANGMPGNVAGAVRDTTIRDTTTVDSSGAGIPTNGGTPATPMAPPETPKD